MRRKLVKVATPQIGEEEIAAVREVLLSGRYVSGANVAAFEEQFAQYIGVEHAVMVNSGTAALHATMAALGLGPGDEVIVPAFTFFSTVTAVIHQNAIPVFADISLDNFALDPSDFERNITSATKAVIPVHYFGHAAEMDSILEIARKHGIHVIEDAAQAHGTAYRGQRVGSLGDMGAFSFFATKHMTTGEGGAVTTNNADWADYMRRFRSHGLEGRNDHVTLGYNYRMTEMAAAIGIVQLAKLEGFNDARIRNSERLIERLRDISWLSLPRVPAHVRHTYFWCHALIDEDRLGLTTEELIIRLRERGVEVRNRYVAPLYRQPLLTDNLPAALKLAAGDRLPAYAELELPNVEKVAGRMIGLPNRPDMTEDEIDHIVSVLAGF